MAGDYRTTLKQILLEAKEKRKSELREFRKNGGIIAGYHCLYSPVEILESCGTVPIRIIEHRGSEDEIRSGQYLRSDSCSFCKATLSNIVDSGEYSCIVSGTTCDQMRRLHEIIPEASGIPVFLFNSPRTSGNENSSRLFKKEMQWIIEELCERTGIKFSEKNLLDSIKEWNNLRSALQKYQQSRVNNEIALTGSDMFYLADAAFYLGPEEFFKTKPRIDELLSSEIPSNAEIKILFAGSIVSSGDSFITDMIEQSDDAVIISDLTCTGVRWYNKLIKESNDIFSAVCDHYHLNMRCPHRMPNNGLYDFADEQIRITQPDGIILRTLKFCHPWTFEKQELINRYDIPVLHLDTDYSTSNVGQLRTRIQAFTEMLLERKKGARS